MTQTPGDATATRTPAVTLSADTTRTPTVTLTADATCSRRRSADATVSRVPTAEQSAASMLRRNSQSAPVFGSPPVQLGKLIRSKSHHVHGEFGASFKMCVKRNECDVRCLEVSIAFARRQKTVTIELRRLLFWFVFIALLCLPVPALKITPAARMIVNSGTSNLVRSAQSLDTDYQARIPMVEELSNVAIKQSPGVLGLPMFEDDSFAEPLAHFVSKCSAGLAASELRSAAVRSCTSALMHKLIGSVFASDVAHHVGVTIGGFSL